MTVKTRFSRRSWVRLSSAVAPLAAIACLSPLVHGQQLWWDSNGTGNNIGGSGTWDLVKPNWSPDALGIRLVGTPPVSNALLWNNNGTGTATFAGNAGTVDIPGTVTASGIVISTSGYRFRGDGLLQLGNPAGFSGALRVGFINLGTGVTATYSGRLASTPGASRHAELTGAGRLIFDTGNSLVGGFSIRAFNGANVRVTHPDAAFDGDLDIRANARLDFSSLPTATVGSIFNFGSGTIDLGSTVVTSRHSTGLNSNFQGPVTSTATGGLVLSTQLVPPPGVSTFDLVSFTTTSTIGVLRVLNGVLAEFSGVNTFTLASTVDGSAGGTPSLRIESGGLARVSFSHVLALRGFPEVAAGGHISVTQSGRVNILGVNSALRIGSVGTATGGFGLVTVTLPNSSIVADNDIVLGTTAPVNPGIGELRVDTDATVSARRIVINNGLLGLSSSASVTVETLVNSIGNIRLGESSTLTFTGNTTHTLAGTLQNNDTGFGGLLQVNAGTLVVPDNIAFISPFNGTFRIGPAATLRPTRTSLQAAIVHLEPGSTLDLSLVTTPDPLRFGALAGDNPFTLSNRILELAANGTSATYSGRLVTSGLRKVGTGTQTFTGGTAAEPTSVPFLSMNAGVMRLSGANVSLTGEDSAFISEVPLLVSGANARLELDSGAVLTARRRARVYDGATLRLSGAGTQMNVANTTELTGAVLAGVVGGGSVVVTDSARLTVQFLLLGESSQSSAIKSSLTVSNDASIKLRTLQIESPFATLTVDRGTAEFDGLFHRVEAGGGVITLSDPASGAHALTLGTSVSPFNIIYLGSIADGPSGPGSVRFIGPTLRTWNPATNTLSGRVTVDAGKVRLLDPAIFQNNILELNTTTALDVDSITDRPTKNLWFGQLAGSADFDPLDFKDLHIGRSTNAFTESVYSGHLTTSANQRVVKLFSSTQRFSGATIDTPSLTVVGGTVRLENGTIANLTATGSSFFSGDSSLLVDSGTSVAVIINSAVNAVGSLQVHSSGFMVVGSGSSLALSRSGEVPAQLRLGYVGGVSQLVVEAASTVTSQDSIEIGSQNVGNPGIGTLNVSSSTVTTPALIFNNSASQLNMSVSPFLDTPTTLNIATLTSNPLAPNAAISLSGASTLNLINPANFPLSSSFTSPTSSYSGRFTGVGTINTSVPLLDLALNPTLAGSINVTAGTLRIRQSQPLTTIGPTINLTGGTLDLGAPNSILSVFSTSAVFGPDGGYLVDLASSNGTTSSILSDVLILNSLLALTSTPADPFILTLRSLSTNGTPGPLSSFNPGAPFAVPIVTASGGVTALNPAAFTIDTTGFQNPFAGTFSLRTAPGLLYLTYTPGVIPEPAALSLLALTAFALTRRRRC